MNLCSITQKLQAYSVRRRGDLRLQKNTILLVLQEGVAGEQVLAERKSGIIFHRPMVANELNKPVTHMLSC